MKCWTGNPDKIQTMAAELSAEQCHSCGIKPVAPSSAKVCQNCGLRVVQCAVRCGLARRELRQLRAWFEEEHKWRQALKRRRARIERLERELRHVENMPALDVDRYAATARYGMRGVEAAVQTIQGAWRSLLRMRRRQRQRRERQNRAAEVLQRFFRKYPRLRKTRCAAVLPRVSHAY